jgi:hypothetical protein
MGVCEVITKGVGRMKRSLRRIRFVLLIIVVGTCILSPSCGILVGDTRVKGGKELGQYLGGI